MLREWLKHYTKSLVDSFNDVSVLLKF